MYYRLSYSSAEVSSRTGIDRSRMPSTPRPRAGVRRRPAFLSSYGQIVSAREPCQHFQVRLPRVRLSASPPCARPGRVVGFRPSQHFGVPSLRRRETRPVPRTTLGASPQTPRGSRRSPFAPCTSPAAFWDARSRRSSWMRAAALVRGHGHPFVRKTGARDGRPQATRSRRPRPKGTRSAASPTQHVQMALPAASEQKWRCQQPRPRSADAALQTPQLRVPAPRAPTGRFVPPRHRRRAAPV